MKTREVDLLAEKWENMFFVSLRNLGDAGDSGWLWKGALGEARSALLKWFGDVGLLGLIGAFGCSFAFLPLMARDKVVDLGILRSCFRGGLQGYCMLSTGLPQRHFPIHGQCTSESVSCSMASMSEREIACPKMRCDESGGRGGFSRRGPWVAAVVGVWMGVGARSTGFCLPMAVSGRGLEGEILRRAERFKALRVVRTVRSLARCLRAVTTLTAGVHRCVSVATSSVDAAARWLGQAWSPQRRGGGLCNVRVPLFCADRLPGGSSRAADEGGCRWSRRQHSQQGCGRHKGQGMPYNVSRQ